MKLIEYNSKEQQADWLAKTVAGQLNDGLAGGETVSFAVPGGTTPAPFLQALAAHDVDWNKVHVTLTDERQVPADNERSNAKLLRDNFLVKAEGAHFQPLYDGDQADIANTATQLASSCMPLNVCVLGMGADGHFASLFPGVDNLTQGLDAENPGVLMEITGDKVPEPRISLTLSAILSAAHVHVLITGDEKLQVLTQAQQNERLREAEIQLPIQALLRHAGEKLSVHYSQ